MNEVTLEQFKESLRNVNLFISDMPRRMEQLNMEVDYFHDEINDIIHKLESKNFNASYSALRAKEIGIAQRKKRVRKDELHYLRNLEKRLKGVLKNPDGIKQLVQVISNVEEDHATRTYTPRVRHDLFEGAQHFEQIRED